jgi:DNA replication protein DnaC
MMCARAFRALAQESEWVAKRENIFVSGPTGVGKSFVASALAQKACRDGYSVLYARTQTLFRDLALARADGSLRHLLAKSGRVDVMVIDDWAMAPLTEAERRDFREISEERYQRRSTVLTSQLPIGRWHEQIGDPTLADGILDRLGPQCTSYRDAKGIDAQTNQAVAQSARFGSLRTPFPARRQGASASLRIIPD